MNSLFCLNRAEKKKKFMSGNETEDFFLNICVSFVYMPEPSYYTNAQ